MTAAALSDGLTTMALQRDLWKQAADEARRDLDTALIERDALRTALLAAEARCDAAHADLAQARFDHGLVVAHLTARMAALRLAAVDVPHRMAHDAWCWRNHQCPATEETSR